MFGYSGQLNTRCEALVAQGSPAELNQPPILFNAKKPAHFLSRLTYLMKSRCYSDYDICEVTPGQRGC